MFARAIENLRPRPRTPGLVFARKYIVNENAKPYDTTRYPHVCAPGGPWCAVDDPRVRVIWLQWGIRMGKTAFGQDVLARYAAIDPCQMMFATETQELSKRVVKRFYKKLEKNPKLADQLLPDRLRGKTEIDLRFCSILVAWAGSKWALADADIRVGHGNEIDKWRHDSNATEGHPFDRFMSRGSNYPNRKYVVESTPSIKGQSRVERGRLGSTNCSYWVPCPHCRRYQLLAFKRIKWKKDENGNHDKDLARETAVYNCEHCDKRIEDHQRIWMVRRGVWAPEGCRIEDQAAIEAAENWYDRLTASAEGSDGAAIAGRLNAWQGWEKADWIIGKPRRNGFDAGYHISRLYDLSLTWGDLAAQWVEVQGSRRALQQFLNEWLAETWEQVERKESWEKIGQKIITETPADVVPLGHSLLTLGIDCQADARKPYTLQSWGPEQTCHVLRYGEATSWEELIELLMHPWRHEDGGPSLTVKACLIDSGFRPKLLRSFLQMCRARSLPVLPCKGSSEALATVFRIRTQNEKAALPGERLVFVDSIETQDWIESAVYDNQPPDPNSLSLYASDVLTHQDFLQQLVNDGPAETLDKNANVRITWQRINTAIPNDFRDTVRYGYTAMMMETQGRPIPDRAAIATAPATTHAPPVGHAAGGETRPDGRSWL